MLIAASCLHCPDATIYTHDFSVNHMRTTYAHNNLSAQSDQPIAVEIPLPLINCFWSVLVFTDPDQLGVTEFFF